jgi:hypothetical protein
MSAYISLVIHPVYYKTCRYIQSFSKEDIKGYKNRYRKELLMLFFLYPLSHFLNVLSVRHCSLDIAAFYLMVEKGLHCHIVTYPWPRNCLLIAVTDVDFGLWSWKNRNI